MSKPMVQLSVTHFHFVKPGLIKHVLFVSMGLKLRYPHLLKNNNNNNNNNNSNKIHQRKYFFSDKNLIPQLPMALFLTRQGRF